MMESLLKKIRNLEKQILFSFFFGLLVFLALAFWSDFQQTSKVLLSFRLSLIPLILGLSLFNYFLRFLRFKYFIKVTGLKVMPSDSLLIFFSGLSMTVTPGKVGELLKAYFLYRVQRDTSEERLGRASRLKRVGKNHFAFAVPVIVVERLTDGLAAIILASLGITVFRFGGMVFLVGILICLALIIILKNESFFIKTMGVFYFTKRFIPSFEKFFKSGKVLVSFKNLSVGTFLGSLAWGAECLGLALILIGLNVPFSKETLLASFFIFCFSSLLGFLSFFPAGLIITEGSLTGLLIGLLGFSRAIAVSATILLRIFTLWFGVLLGIISLFIFIKKKL